MRNCGCGVEIAGASKTGRCRKCAVKDPDLRALRLANLARSREDPELSAKRMAAIAATFAKPETKVRQRNAACAAYARGMRDPVYRAKRSASGRKAGDANFLAGQTPEARAKAGATNRARLLAWCPPELWDLNQTLKRKGHRLEARKEIIASKILAPIAPDAAQYLRRISPITQCTEAGRPSSLGRFWLYAGKLRSASEVVRLAEVKGWRRPCSERALGA